LFDDMIDGTESPMAVFGPYVVDILHGYKVGMAGGEADTSLYSPATRMAVGILKEVIAVDAEGAEGMFRWIGKWGKLILGQLGGQRQPRDFDEYLEYRRVDIGAE
jgi:hypothetical protein